MNENTKSLPDMLRDYNDKAKAATELGLEYRERTSQFESMEEADKALKAIESSLDAMIESLSEPDESDYNDISMAELLAEHDAVLVHQAKELGLECRRMGVEPFPSVNDGVWACYLLRARVRHALHLRQEVQSGSRAGSASPRATEDKSKENDDVKTTKKTTKKTKPAAKVKAKTKTKKIAATAKKQNGAVRSGSKTAIIAALLQRKSGCTLAQVLEATKWTAVSMPAMAKNIGLKLRKEKKDGVTVYYGS